MYKSKKNKMLLNFWYLLNIDTICINIHYFFRLLQGVLGFPYNRQLNMYLIVDDNVMKVVLPNEETSLHSCPRRALRFARAEWRHFLALAPKKSTSLSSWRVRRLFYDRDKDFYIANFLELNMKKKNFLLRQSILLLSYYLLVQWVNPLRYACGCVNKWMI